MAETNQNYELIKLVRRVTKYFKQEIHKQMGDIGFTPPQGMLIGALMKKGPCKVSDLSDMLSLSNSTVSGIIDRLEKSGQLTRIRSDEDRRVVMVDLTENFREESAARFRGVDNLMIDIFSQAEPDEIEEIVKGLTALENVFLRHKGVDTKK